MIRKLKRRQESVCSAAVVQAVALSTAEGL